MIEWSPYSFQTPEENAERHKRREEEISVARDRIIAPALKMLSGQDVEAKGIVQHGHVADTLDRVAREEGVDLIVIGRDAGGSGLRERLFGSVPVNLAATAAVPVTIVPT